MWRAQPTKGSTKKTNIKSHETWYARACNGGGRGSDTFEDFMYASFIDYNFSWPPGKSSTPRKPAKTSGAKKYTPELLRQAHQAVAQRKDLVQALSEASTAMVMQDAKQKATERLGRQMHYEKAQAEAKAMEQRELATIAGYRITPVLGFWTLRDLHWVKFTFETGFELSSSCVDLP